jgi:hypothetical protein
MSESELPNGLINFGPDANCTLELCPLEWSVYQYRPSLPANAFFLAVYGLFFFIHAIIGFRWRYIGFTVCMMLGCALQVGGYAGRIILYDNPFDFIGFLVQIILITCAPVFFTAAIYVTLSQTIVALGPDASRFKPQLFYWIFIPADVLCLTLQAAGGALSTTSKGSSTVGVDVSMAGLILQVIVLAAFCGLFVDYLVRRARLHGATRPLNTRLRLYLGGLSLAILLILARCIYRCYELSQGYRDSEVITDEGLFIALEGVLIVLATASLCIGHPGFAFTPSFEIKGASAPQRHVSDVESLQEPKPST